jgi:hypothetical protein
MSNSSIFVLYRDYAGSIVLHKFASKEEASLYLSDIFSDEGALDSPVEVYDTVSNSKDLTWDDPFVFAVEGTILPITVKVGMTVTIK